MTAMRFAFAAVCACLVAGTSASIGPSGGYSGIDVIRPSPSDESGWDGDRMRGARERLKDIVPRPLT